MDAALIAATDAAEKAHAIKAKSARGGNSSATAAAQLTSLESRLLQAQDALTQHHATLETRRRQRRHVLLPKKWEELDKLLDQHFVKGAEVRAFVFPTFAHL